MTPLKITATNWFEGCERLQRVEFDFRLMYYVCL